MITFLPERFFQGSIECWGLFEARFTPLKRRFKLLAEGRWDGRTLCLEEVLTYDDGEVNERVWVIEKRGDGAYTARTDEVKGEAIGVVKYGVLTWRYDFLLNIGKRPTPFAFTDRMMMVDESTVMNEVTISKFGVQVGRITAAFRKADADVNATPARSKAA